MYNSDYYIYIGIVKYSIRFRIRHYFFVPIRPEYSSYNVSPFENRKLLKKLTTIGFVVNVVATCTQELGQSTSVLLRNEYTVSTGVWVREGEGGDWLSGTQIVANGRYA